MGQIPTVSDYIRYEMTESRLFFSDGKTRDLAKADIQSLDVICDYGKNILPVISLSIKTDYETYIKIIKDREKVQIQLKMEYYKYMETTQEKGPMYTWFNRKFDIYTEDDYPDLIKKTLEKVQETTKSNEQESKTDSAQNRTLDVNLILFVTDDVNAAYADGGGVYSNANMETVVTHCLSTAGAKKVLMTPFDNKQSYPQIMLPPFTLIGRLQYLNSVYGFYNTGMLCFFGLERMYLIDRSAKCTAMEQHEYINVVFLVRDEEDEARRFDGSRQENDQKTMYINVQPENLAFNSPSIMNNMLKGSVIKTVDSHTNKIDTLNTKNRKRGKAYSKWYNNKFGNPYAAKEVASELTRDDRVVVIPFQDANINFFRPNKEFSLRFMNSTSDSLYGSKLSLYYTRFLFNNHGDHFRVNISSGFKKA